MTKQHRKSGAKTVRFNPSAGARNILRWPQHQDALDSFSVKMLECLTSPVSE